MPIGDNSPSVLRERYPGKSKNARLPKRPKAIATLRQINPLNKTYPSTRQLSSNERG
ncbi:hypothetical protein C1646_767524 [Rhizophagus diaphanus]|nr:hypothetical protein C1646_767524 [Rhizophagus diaphanus] [Rhizophagus sp. MUCL 43196]